jgi:hypothetical protein
VKSANLVLGVCAMILSAIIFVVGKSAGLQFLRGTTPGPAFMPFLTSWGIGFCGLVLVLRSLMRTSEADTGRENRNDAENIWIFKKKNLWNFLIVIITSVFIVLFAKLLGLLASLAIGVAVMAKLLGTPGWKTPIFVGIFSGITFFLVFDLFLQVPLPRGIFGL